MSGNVQVVEASQDFVPLLLLTADRPSELQDAGANQAINQVCPSCIFKTCYTLQQTNCFEQI